MCLLTARGLRRLQLGSPEKPAQELEEEEEEEEDKEEARNMVGIVCMLPDSLSACYHVYGMYSRDQRYHHWDPTPPLRAMLPLSVVRSVSCWLLIIGVGGQEAWKFASSSGHMLPKARQLL